MNLRPPKDLHANIEWRKKLLRAAELEGEELQRELWILCKRDICFWLDAFGWTFANKDHTNNPDRPFICWDYQEQTFADITAAIGRHDLALEKSRDMGASWMVLASFAHRMTFFTGQAFKICSRNEDYVDKKGDPKCLMWKIDYLLRNTPIWLQPPGWTGNRTRLHIEAPTMGSAINGESTTKNMARGDRLQAVLLDEFAAVEEGYPVLAATRDATYCRIFVSTPQGATGAYYDQLMKMKQETPDYVKRLHWSVHPIKSKGLYTDESGKVRSPWYDAECKRAATEWEISQELDINYVASGTQAIDQTVVDRLLMHAKHPLLRGEMAYGGGDEPDFTNTANGRLKLWLTLVKGAPPRDTEYAIGCDIAMGKGGEQSSQSVASVINRKTGLKVAEFCVRDMEPSEFADYVVAMCKWFRGRSGGGAYLIWEQNGPGETFSQRVVKHLHYTNIYLRSDPHKVTKKVSNSPGWWSNKDSKRVLLTEYFRALKDGTFTNWSAAALQETTQYVVDGSGYEHCRSSQTADPMAQGENHGDMVIADALANRALRELPSEETLNSSVAPEGSFAWRQKQHTPTSKRGKAYC
jgi:hypothetical protein